MTSLDFSRQFNRLDFMPSLGLGLMHALNGTMGKYSKNSNQINKIYLCMFITNQISINCDHSQVANFKNYYHGGMQYAILINCTHNPNPLHQLICAQLSLISSGAFYCIHRSKFYLSLTESPSSTHGFKLWKNENITSCRRVLIEAIDFIKILLLSNYIKTSCVGHTFHYSPSSGIWLAHFW